MAYRDNDKKSGQGDALLRKTHNSLFETYYRSALAELVPNSDWDEFEARFLFAGPAHLHACCMLILQN